MPSAAHAVPAVVVRQEKDDVRPIGGLDQGVRRNGEQNGNKPRQPSEWSSHAGQTINLAKRLAKPNAKIWRVVVTTQGKGNHAVRSGRYRYIRYADGGEELYDHKTDPHEWRNLAGDQSLAKVKLRLAKRLPGVNAEPIQIKRRQ